MTRACWILALLLAFAGDAWALSPDEARAGDPQTIDAEVLLRMDDPVEPGIGWFGETIDSIRFKGKGGLRYKRKLHMGERKMELRVLGPHMPLLKGSSLGVTFEVRF